MNFLAHLWLADRAGADLSGAVLGDVVRGPVPDTLPGPVAASVRLHRRIDAATDRDPAVATAREAFPTGPRRFAGIFLDLAFDHLLARDWRDFHAEPLPRFAARCADAVSDAAPLFRAHGGRAPTRLGFRMLLRSYAEPPGFEAALRRTAQRLRRPEGLLATLEGWEARAAALRPELPGLLARLSEVRPEAD